MASRLDSQVLLECKEDMKTVSNKLNKGHLPLVLEETRLLVLENTPRQDDEEWSGVDDDVEPALLEEITREHQDISKILKI